MRVLGPCVTNARGIGGLCRLARPLAMPPQWDSTVFADRGPKVSQRWTTFYSRGVSGPVRHASGFGAWWEFLSEIALGTTFS